MPKRTQSTKIEPIVPQRKRGRKPKGGKIITITEETKKNDIFSTNVIVHLKCKKSDILPTDEISNVNVSSYIEKENEQYEAVVMEKQIEKRKTIHDKLKQLQVNLHNNVVNETASACFWCTYNFNNLPIFIPKFEINKTYHVYGCFCSPECACAHLMNENIDSSVKFERYHLLCYIYSKVYDYKQNIKPAPDPRYTLKKFYGNLTIEEYRELFDSEKHLFIIDKPISRELPELHEEFPTQNNFNYVPTKPQSQNIMNTFTNIAEK
jgi:GTP cyclohydrolase II